MHNKLNYDLLIIKWLLFCIYCTLTSFNILYFVFVPLISSSSPCSLSSLLSYGLTIDSCLEFSGIGKFNFRLHFVYRVTVAQPWLVGDSQLAALPWRPVPYLPVARVKLATSVTCGNKQIGTLVLCATFDLFRWQPERKRRVKIGKSNIAAAW